MKVVLEDYKEWDRELYEFFYMYDSVHDFSKQNIYTISQISKYFDINISANLLSKKLISYYDGKISQTNINQEHIIKKLKHKKQDIIASTYKKILGDGSTNFIQDNFAYIDNGSKKYLKCYNPFKSAIDRAPTCSGTQDDNKYREDFINKMKKYILSDNIKYYNEIIHNKQDIWNLDFFISCEKINCTKIKINNNKNNIEYHVDCCSNINFSIRDIKNILDKVFLIKDEFTNIQTIISLFNNENIFWYIDEIKYDSNINYNINIPVKIITRFLLALKRSGDWGQCQLSWYIKNVLKQEYEFSTIDLPCFMIAHKIFKLSPIFGGDKKYFSITSEVLRDKLLLSPQTEISTNINNIYNNKEVLEKTTENKIIKKKKVIKNIDVNDRLIYILNILAQKRINNPNGGALNIHQSTTSFINNSSFDKVNKVDKVVREEIQNKIKSTQININKYVLDFYKTIKFQIINKFQKIFAFLCDNNEILIEYFNLQMFLNYIGFIGKNRYFYSIKTGVIEKIKNDSLHNFINNLYFEIEEYKNRDIKQVKEKINAIYINSIDLLIQLFQSYTLPCFYDDEEESGDFNLMSAGRYYHKYLKYKNKYITMKSKISM
jgi:hypothetical protein